MTEIAGTYFDGRTSLPHEVVVRLGEDGGVEVIGRELTLSFSRQQVRVDSRVGNARRFIRLPDDQRCEIADNVALDAALARTGQQRRSRWLHRIEASWRLALVASGLLLLLGWGVIRYVLPAAARHVAFALPETAVNRMGQDSLATLDRLAFKPSALSRERQSELQAKFQDFLKRAGDDYQYRIEFRSSDLFGANAFALPSGAIVLTDELIALAEDDDEIVGVLAHECGHVRQRHILRTVLQNSAVVVIFAFISGDVSSATAFGSALPAFLLQNKFSQEFEREADLDGAEWLRRGGIDPQHLATMLKRLTEKHGGLEGKYLYHLSSHPPTRERIRDIVGRGTDEAGQ